MDEKKGKKKRARGANEMGREKTKNGLNGPVCTGPKIEPFPKIGMIIPLFPSQLDLKRFHSAEIRPVLSLAEITRKLYSS